MRRMPIETHAREVHAYEVHAYGGILRGPSASEHRRTSVPAPARVSALPHRVPVIVVVP
jgi:hypothetical protein